jgi:hypothetical protein
VIRFRLRKPGKVELVVRADSSACKIVGRKRVRGHAGRNRVPFNGRVNGRPLAAGKYTITVVVVRGGHRTQVGTLAVEIVSSGRRLTRAQQHRAGDYKLLRGRLLLRLDVDPRRVRRPVR